MIAVNQSAVIAVRLAAFLADRSSANRSALAEACVPIAHQVARSVARGRAEDVFGASGVGLMRAIDTYDAEKSLDFEGFVRWRVRCEISNDETASRRGVEPADVDFDAIPSPDSDDRLRDAAAAALDSMEPIEREIVELHYFGGRTLAEIGDRLKVCRAEVHRIKSRALVRAAACARNLD